MNRKDIQRILKDGFGMATASFRAWAKNLVEPETYNWHSAARRGWINGWQMGQAVLRAEQEKTETELRNYHANERARDKQVLERRIRELEQQVLDLTEHTRGREYADEALQRWLKVSGLEERPHVEWPRIVWLAAWARAPHWRRKPADEPGIQKVKDQAVEAQDRADSIIDQLRSEREAALKEAAKQRDEVKRLDGQLTLMGQAIADIGRERDAAREGAEAVLKEKRETSAYFERICERHVMEKKQLQQQLAQGHNQFAVHQEEDRHNRVMIQRLEIENAKLKEQVMDFMAGNCMQAKYPFAIAYNQFLLWWENPGERPPQPRDPGITKMWAQAAWMESMRQATQGGYKGYPVTVPIQKDPAAKEEEQMRLIAAATAHRACCGTEHDPANGKLHGYCVVCGQAWPCQTAKCFLLRP